MTIYDDPTIATSRRILDAMDREIDKAIAAHNTKLEDALSEEWESARLQHEGYLRELQRRGVAA